MTKPRRLFVVRPSLGSGGADRVTVTLLRSLPRDIFRPSLILMRREGELLQEIPNDVPLFCLEANSLWTAWLPLVKLFRRERPDVIFSTSSGMNVVAILAAVIAGRDSRLVLSERGGLREELSRAKQMLRLIKRWLYPFADRITTVSQGIKEELISRLHLPKESISVVYNPVVENRLPALAGEPIDHPWFGSDIPVVLTVGRLVVEKDHANLLRAFAQMRKNTAARLFILGDGPLRGALSVLGEQLGLGQDVCFAEFDPNPFRYMARCSVFVLSSRFEGLPGALIQAMACGAPVVSTDCPSGPAEIIEPGIDGLLVPVGESSELAHAMKRILESRELGRRLGRRGQESAQRFNVDRVLGRYVDALLGENPLR